MKFLSNKDNILNIVVPLGLTLGLLGRSVSEALLLFPYVMLPESLARGSYQSLVRLDTEAML